jgi:hypothetical protein
MDESPNDRSLEEHRFTRTRSGWRFTAPMVWPLGGRVYLVNETRKAELLRRLEQWRRWINRLYLLWFIPMVVVHETRTSDDLVEALSQAIGLSYGVVAAAIVAPPVILISVGTPALQLLAIRSILARAIALPTRVGLWERFLATPESLAGSNS